MTLGRRRWLGALAGLFAGGVAVDAASAAQARGLTFEIYEDAKKEFRWRLKSSNGQVIASSGQGYKAKADCKNAIQTIQKGAADAKVEDTTAAK